MTVIGAINPLENKRSPYVYDEQVEKFKFIYECFVSFERQCYIVHAYAKHLYVIHVLFRNNKESRF